MKNVKNYLADLANARWQFPRNKTENPFFEDYAPEMDETPALEQELESWYQYLIGIIRGMVEICIVDTITNVSMMAP